MDIQEQYHLIQLSKGNKDSLGYLHQKYSSKVFHYYLKFVLSREVAEEITLDVFLKLWDKRSILKTDQSVSGLMLKITRDYSISYLRKVAKDTSLRRKYMESYFQ